MILSFVRIVAIATLVLLATPVMAVDGAAFTPWKWQPRAKSIKIDAIETKAGDKANGPTYNVQGRIDTGWNYIGTDQQVIFPGKLYRLSIDLRVDRLGADTPAPYFKGEFIGSLAQGEAGKVHTQPYDILKLHVWQKLTAEFQTPEGVKAFRLALEKGTNAPTEINATIRDVRLEPIARLTVFERYWLKPVPEQLEAMRGVHPRLYLTKSRIAELREAIKTTHADIWRRLRIQADRAVKSGPPQYIKDDGKSGDEQLWERDVGNTLPLLAMAYLLTGEKTYLDATKRWALTSSGYTTWGLGPIDGLDLATGHQLFGLGLVYDWLYHDLDKDTLKTIRQTLQKRGSAMFQAAATGKAWWHQSFLQNHLWVNSAGMNVAGLALFDEVDEALSWIGYSLDAFQQSMAALGSDGASHEGVGYWEYGVEYMLKFMDLSRTLLGVELGDRDWWRKTSLYSLYLSLPRNAWTRDYSVVDIADSPRNHWYGPEYMLRDLARRRHDGHAQWLAQEIETADVAGGGAPWLNLIWFDPKVAPEAPRDLRKLHHFEDMGIVSARSSWDGDESLVVGGECGASAGHTSAGR